MSTLLTREGVLQADDLRTDTVEIPEWGGAVQVRGLTLAEVNSIVSLSTKKGITNTLDSAIWTFIRGCVSPAFTDLDFDDLKKKNAALLRAVKRINELSGMTDGGGLAVADAEKN